MNWKCGTKLKCKKSDMIFHVTELKFTEKTPTYTLLALGDPLPLIDLGGGRFKEHEQGFMHIEREVTEDQQDEYELIPR